jgi:regulator of sirC expression with transglutaminase-like and TPR domain
MRALIKQVQGPNAELSASYYETASNRDILIRLQNNIKLRQIEMEDYTGALRTVETMRLIDPGEFRLLLDAGVLYAKVGRPQAAVPMLNNYIDHLPIGHRNRQDAQQLLAEILRQIN